MESRTPPLVKILLVDDKPENLMALEAVLQQPGYDLVECASGLEAIKLARRHEFAMILLDIQMPELDGYETARRIKALPEHRDTPIIFVTAVYKEDADVMKGYEAGGLDYFSKPFNPEVLRAKVRIYADLRQMRLRIREQEKLLAQLAAANAAQGSSSAEKPPPKGRTVSLPGP